MLIDGALVNNGFYFNDFTTLYLYCLLLVDRMYLPPNPCYYKHLCYKHISICRCFSRSGTAGMQGESHLVYQVFVIIHTLINKL